MTPSLERFIERFASLPTLGPRQATRLAFYLIRQGKETIRDLAEALYELMKIEACEHCFNPMKGNGGRLCEICASRARRPEVIAIVEKETDLLSIEKTGKFRGHYLILGEMSNEGMLTELQKLRLNHLKQRIKKLPGGCAEEVIVALNPTTYGDLDATLIVQDLKPFAKKITRLGRGLPTGGEIEFADEETLGGALEHRS